MRSWGRSPKSVRDVVRSALDRAVGPAWAALSRSDRRQAESHSPVPRRLEVVASPAPQSTLPQTQTQTLAWTSRASALPLSAATVTLSSAGEPSAPQNEYLLAKVLPVDLTESALIAMHDATGLPWWASLAAAAVCVRVMVFPLNFLQLQEAARISRMSGFFSIVRQGYRILTLAQNSEWRQPLSRPEAIGQTLAVARYLLKPLGLRSSRFFLPVLASVPAFITFNLACRRLLLSQPNAPHAQAAPKPMLDGTVPVDLGDASASAAGALGEHAASLAALHTEGVAWCPDLAQADPYYALPAIAVAVTVLNIHTALYKYTPTKRGAEAEAAVAAATTAALGQVVPGDAVKGKMSTRLVDVLGAVLTAGVVVVAPLTLSLPSGYFIYWIIVMSVSALQSRVSRTAAVRRLAGFSLPPLLVPAPLMRFQAARRPPEDLNLYPPFKIKSFADASPDDLHAAPEFLTRHYTKAAAAEAKAAAAGGAGAGAGTPQPAKTNAADANAQQR